ncbi:MAG: bifunctional acetate--CoA ligase family protein/GNAT family N-acetyltransferase [Magnetospirillum sp. WYHS-4]
MTVRNLDKLFKPKSIALIGASNRPQSVGAVLAGNLFLSGFEGPVMPVNPKHQAIHGVLTYKDVASLPVTPDLAVISTPPHAIPGIVAELGARGTRAAVVITAGFGEGADEAGRALKQSLLDAAKPYSFRIIGPNCLGIMAPRIGLNASFCHVSPKTGPIAFVAQSGAIVTSVVDWAHSRGIGFSHLVSLGDMADVDFGDMLDYLANDPNTRAILMYVEAVTSARKFMSAARAAARMKPVIVVKAGRYAEGAKAAASHTGALAGLDSVYDAVFKRAGMLRVISLTQLFDAVEVLAMMTPPEGDRLAILTNGGGIGVLATDALVALGGRLAQLQPETIQKLNAVLPPTWSHGNPVDIIGDAPGKRYEDSLRILLADKGVDTTLVLNCPTAVASPIDAARAVATVAGERKGQRVLTSWVGDSAARESRHLFEEKRIPTYDTPEQAVRAFTYLVNYKRSQELLMETPLSMPEDFTVDADRARTIAKRAVEDGRDWLTEPEAKSMLAAYGIPTVPTHIACTPDEAAGIAAELGGPVVLKVLSPDITHKSDIGGVLVDIAGPALVKAAAAEMLDRIGKARPDARLEGVTVQPMVRRPGAYELIMGVLSDPQFGPIILFGHGGTAVEVIDDKALGLPPLNMRLARELMSNTRIYKQLTGFRGLKAVNLDAVALTLLKISQLVVDVPEISELDINPLLADEWGVVALDARVKVKAAHGSGADRLAIRPYPKDLEQEVPLGDGRLLFLRPVVPEDEPSLQETFARLTPEEIRLRFFVPMQTMSHLQAARFTQIDYDREMALILTERGIPGKTPIYGTVHINADPDLQKAEYAIMVEQEMTGLGLGVFLMRRIIEYAKSRGIGEIHGDVLRENGTMLKLCRALGFTQSNNPDDTSIVKVVLKL